MLCIKVTTIPWSHQHILPMITSSIMPDSKKRRRYKTVYLSSSNQQFWLADGLCGWIKEDHCHSSFKYSWNLQTSAANMWTGDIAPAGYGVQVLPKLVCMGGWLLLDIPRSWHSKHLPDLAGLEYSSQTVQSWNARLRHWLLHSEKSS